MKHIKGLANTAADGIPDGGMTKSLINCTLIGPIFVGRSNA